MASEVALRNLDVAEQATSPEDPRLISHTGHELHEHHDFSLPPADRGKEAWLFLAGAFMVEALVWGFPFTYGIFQEYYSTHPSFAGRSGIPLIGTLSSGIMYLSAPIVFTTLSQYPRWRRPASAFGLAVCAASFLAASFMNTVVGLALTQGVMYALGGSLLYSPAILWLDEWFVERKGMAYGVMWAGTGVSGVVLPLIMNSALERYGYRIVHRWTAFFIVVLVGPLLVYTKPRVPVSAHTNTRRISTRFLKSPTFWALQAGNMLQGFGFFLPSIYLPTYSQSFNLSPTISTILLSLLNAASVFGQIFLGALSDHMHVTSVILISTIGSTFAVLVFWGLATSQVALLCVFSILYGFFAGGYSSTFAGCCTELRKKYPQSDLGFVFGMFAGGRGVGNVLCGPLSEALVRSWRVGAGGAFGTRYGGLVVFTGVSAAAGSVGWLARIL